MRKMHNLLLNKVFSCFLSYVIALAYCLPKVLRIAVFIMFAVSGANLFLPVLSLAGTIDLPRTGQTTSYAAGDDGSIQAGIAWPTPRFTDNGNGTITDNLTGLMWLKDANCINTKYPAFDNDGTGGDGAVTWQHGLDFMAGINAGIYSNCGAGHNDWRLPNVNELESLKNVEQANPGSWLNSQGFTNVQTSFYWSSTTDSSSTNDAWNVDIHGNVDSSILEGYDKGHANYVWPVRAVTTQPAQIWKTGQTISYAAGDDGNLQKGGSWPSPRFTDNGDGTVTDNLTGLMWLKDANCFGRKTWQPALNTIANFNANPSNYNCQSYTASYTDWRLPNRKELHSLTDFSRFMPALPSGHPFTNVQASGDWLSWYWSSTTYANTTDYVWHVGMQDGYVGTSDKNSDRDVWPVRAGSVSIATTTTTTTPPPTIFLSPTSLSFSATQGGSNPASQTVSVTNTGGGTLSWSASDDATWLSLSPTSGTAPSSITESANISGMSAGTHNATITITSTGATNSPQTIPVTLTINPPPVTTTSTSTSTTSSTTSTTSTTTTTSPTTSTTSTTTSIPTTTTTSSTTSTTTSTPSTTTSSTTSSTTSTTTIEPASTISCNVSTTLVTFGNPVTVSGAISPAHAAFVDIIFTPPQGSQIIKGTSANSNGEFSFIADHRVISRAGRWTVKTRWNGDSDHPGATSPEQSFTVNKAITNITINASSQSIVQAERVDITGKITPFPDPGKDLSGLTISLTITSPTGTSTTQTATTLDQFGHYAFRNLSFIIPGKWTIQASIAETETYLSASSSQLQINVVQSAGYAILIQGRISSQEGLKSHIKTSSNIYRQLLDRGFLDSNIYYFSYDKLQAGVDATPSESEISQAIEAWARNKMNAAPANLYIIMVDHGYTNSFYIHPDTITPTELAGWLNNLEAGLNNEAMGQKRVVIYGACRSGSFIPALSKSGRIIITSAAANEDSFKGPLDEDGVRDGEYFLSELFKSVAKGGSLKEGFEEAAKKTEKFSSQAVNKAPLGKAAKIVQHPLLDDNGDTTGSNRISDYYGDGKIAKGLYLGVSALTANAPGAVEISSVAPTITLSPSETTPLLWAKVTDNARLDTIWIEVKPPDFSLATTQATEQREMNLPKKAYTAYNAEKDRYEWSDYSGFTASGTYDVLYFARDSQNGEISSFKETIAYKGKDGNNPPQVFNLLLPGDGEETSTVLALDWEDSIDPDGDSITYTVLISRDKTFSTVDFMKERIEGSDYLVDSSAGLQDYTTYYWKVLAVDYFGAVKESSVRSFITNNTNGIPGILAGHILNATTLEPISGAELKATVGGQIRGSARSLPNGSYFLFLSPGSYAITASVPGFSSASQSEVEVSQGDTVTVNLLLKSNDTIAPSVASVTPPHEAKEVPMDSKIIITFSEDMKLIGSDYAPEGSVRLMKGDSFVEGTGGYSSVDKTFTIAPSGLSYNTSYTVMVIAGAKDLAGNGLASEFTSSFRTVESATVPPKPGPVSTGPNDGPGPGIGGEIKIDETRPKEPVKFHVPVRDIEGKLPGGQNLMDEIEETVRTVGNISGISLRQDPKEGTVELTVGEGLIVSMIPTGDIVQLGEKPKEPLISIDQDKATVILTTSSGVRVNFSAAPQSFSGFNNALRNARIAIDQVEVFDDHMEVRFSGMTVSIRPDFLVIQTKESPGIRVNEQGNLVITYENGKQQIFFPSIANGKEFMDMIKSLSGVEKVQMGLDGIITISFKGGTVKVRPDLVITEAPPGTKAGFEVTKDGSILVTFKDGRQQIVRVVE